MNLTDIDKVLTGLDCLITTSVDCDGCPYNKDENSSCMKNIAKDALDLINYQHEHIEAFLKDQEPLEPVRMHHTEHKQTDNYRCKFCGNDMYFEQRYCEYCGKKVKWDE